MERFWKSVASIRAFGLVLIAAIWLPCATAHGEAVSYSLMLCENLAVLKDPTNKTQAMNAAWKSQHGLMLDRTMPYVELRNTSHDAVITQISMTIGDTSKNYDWAQLVEGSPGVAFSLITPDGANGGAKADTLVISFTGLDPGDFVRFRTGLSPDNTAGSMIVDYRMAFFNMNGSDPSSNSMVTVNFENSQGTQSLVKQLPNFTSGGMPSFTSLAFPDHYMDMVMPYSFGDSGTIGDDEEPEPDPDPEPDPAVPEPGSIVLLGSGLLVLAVCGIRHRRARRGGTRAQA